jgi:uncharacterized protein involved in response to NO
MLSPTVLHGVAMTFGFAPLFFTGFLFTAGPKWLGVAAPAARELLPAIALQGIGWMLWLWGAQFGLGWTMSGGLLAWAGLALTQWRFWGLLRHSAAPDTTHARLIALAGGMGVLSLAGALLATAQHQTDLARAWNLTGLWAYVVLVYVVVAHRMIPFFTASALPLISAWRPMWVLWFLTLAVAQKVLSVWFDHAAWHWPAWSVASSFWMLVTGLILLWLAFVWGLVQSLGIRLLAMLHIGFLWLGLGFLLDATGHFWTLITGEPSWSLGAMHATTMGFMGSLLMAMVTRVSCGHGGRVLVADHWVWALFWLLQLATLARVAAAVLGPQHQMWLTLAAVTLWVLAMGPWSVRLMRWYGRPRADGRPG